MDLMNWDAKLALKIHYQTTNMIALIPMFQDVQQIIMEINFLTNVLEL